MRTVEILILDETDVVPSKQNDPKTPYLKNAEVKTLWIPDRIEGNKYEEGHFVHIIDKQATWGGQ